LCAIARTQLAGVWARFALCIDGVADDAGAILSNGEGTDTQINDPCTLAERNTVLFGFNATSMSAVTVYEHLGGFLQNLGLVISERYTSQLTKKTATVIVNAQRCVTLAFMSIGERLQSLLMSLQALARMLATTCLLYTSPSPRD
jgi:hypothetical protein